MQLSARYAVMGHSVMCHTVAKYIIKRIDTTNWLQLQFELSGKTTKRTSR